MAVGRRNQVLLGLALVMILGIAVYLRLWTIDYTVSADDTELLRRQFDLANKEAMDESAEWRLKYDVEAERATKCLGELNKIKESYKKDEHDGNINQKLAVLKKICGLWLVT
ncbi:uncharacterized protein LOC107435029 isoform X4 [Ziziphus jujuba]|uniref:Uncharacterized protein LOC107435029 isoform X4 n=1 Tax=Ziziphus jujuba TaxID=326968 RepID=A0A6P6FP53_ZIZJJ|nr:uncharacterized protein LOC107435029 isoform X4 [Ziziphus jujuba]